MKSNILIKPSPQAQSGEATPSLQNLIAYKQKPFADQQSDKSQIF